MLITCRAAAELVNIPTVPLVDRMVLPVAISTHEKHVVQLIQLVVGEPIWLRLVIGWIDL